MIARRFLRAICKTTIPSLGDKLSGVRDVISQWRAQSPAAKDELPGLGIDLATRHALDLIGTSWEVSYELRELQELSQARGVDLVAAIIRALRDEVLNVRSATWLAFANHSVGAASPAAIGAALERFVSSSGGGPA